MLDILIICFITTCLWWFWSSRLPSSFPPGPRWPLPIVGSSYVLGGNIVKGFQSVHRKYGDIVGFYMGPQRVVVLNNLKLIQTAFTKDEFAGRSKHFESLAIVRGSLSGGDRKLPGVLFSSGQSWYDQRRFTLSTLRDFGFGKQNMDELIEDEVEQLLSKIEESHLDKPLAVQYLFNISVLNALWRILSGERLDYDDPKLNEILRMLTSLLRQQGEPFAIISLFYPFISKIFARLNVLMVFETTKSIFSFMTKSLTWHKETFQEDSRDFIDAYYSHSQSGKSTVGESFQGPNCDISLRNVLLDLFIAGSETTSTTLNWAVLFMATHPRVQEKVQQELDAVVGRSRLPKSSDRPHLPYTDAAINEVQRLGNITPFAIPHAVTRDVTLGGYVIPKDTTVFSNLMAVQQNPEDFPNPSTFRPERFLDADGKFQQHPNMVPFGVGKRRCLGETLARIELFLFFTGLLHRFKIDKLNPEQILEIDPVPGVVLTPKPYQIRMSLRE